MRKDENEAGEETMDEKTPAKPSSRDASGVEKSLRSALQAASASLDAAHGEPVADSDDLSRRIRARAARRNRAAGVAAAVMLVASAGGGYLVGRSRSDGGTTTRLAAADRSIEGDKASGEVASSSAEGPAADESRTSGQGAADRAVDGFATKAAPGMGVSPGSGPAAALFTRTLDDGTVLDVRAYSYLTDGGVDLDGDPSWNAPRWCFPTGSYYVGVRAPDAVGQVVGERYDEVPARTLSVASSVVGVPEGAPRWVLVVQAPAGVTKVRASFPGGGSDEFSPKGGTAVLSARTAESLGPDPLSAASKPGELVVEGLDSNGAVVARWSGDRWGSTGVVVEPGLTVDDDVAANTDAATVTPQPGASEIAPQPAEVPPAADGEAPAEPSTGAEPGFPGTGSPGRGSSCQPPASSGTPADAGQRTPG